MPERCAGRIAGNTISGRRPIRRLRAARPGLRSATTRSLAVGNGGIVVHRWNQGDDGTIITGNRIADTGAAEGGTGQWGNAINVFRTDDVIISDNIISGSAFSAIRANSARGIQIVGNNCRDSGETAIYAEFALRERRRRQQH